MVGRSAAVPQVRVNDEDDDTPTPTYNLAAFTGCVLEPLQRGANHAITKQAFDYRAYAPVDEPLVTVAPQGVVVVEGMFL